MSTSSDLSISVVVPTRNRPEQVAECAAALVRCEGLREAVFIDQSDDDKTQQAVAAAAAADSRLRYERSELRGAANGRNVGLEVTTGSIIAFTDDDCRPAVDWLTTIERIFREDAAAAVICGRVWVPPELMEQGFAISFEPNVREWLGRFPPPHEDWGITANLAARRTTFDRVGKFDPVLGAGAPLQSGEEPDLLFRVLRAGLKVVNAQEVQVKHLGIRRHGAESSELWQTYGKGTAAALFKHIRLGDMEAGKLYLGHLGVMAKSMTKRLMAGERPIGLRYTTAFVEGALNSLKFDIDRTQRLYVKNR
jgi:glycosyltransferase involved in cell wall biosynthesis